MQKQGSENIRETRQKSHQKPLGSPRDEYEKAMSGTVRRVGLIAGLVLMAELVIRYYFHAINDKFLIWQALNFLAVSFLVRAYFSQKTGYFASDPHGGSLEREQSPKRFALTIAGCVLFALFFLFEANGILLPKMLQ